MNCSVVTPTSSEAVAVTFTVPDTVAPAAGPVRLTVGAVVSTPALNTATCITQAPPLTGAVAL